MIHGSFFPTEEKKARKYLEELKNKEPEMGVSLHKVSNLNHFMAHLKKRKKKD